MICRSLGVGGDCRRNVGNHSHLGPYFGIGDGRILAGPTQLGRPMKWSGPQDECSRWPS